MKITFLGSGSAFCLKNYQSNILIENNGKRLLFDCGTDIRWSLNEVGLTALDIDAVYISHLHSDHIGGLEYLAFYTYFSKKRIKLFGNSDIIKNLWNKCLSGGLESLQTIDADLNTYFDVEKVSTNKSFEFSDIDFKLVQTIHVIADYSIVKSYGLMFSVYSKTKEHKVIFITSDTQFAPSQIKDFINISDITFHDCEIGFESRVHAHYNDLKLLPSKFKEKIWLYHYNDEALPDAQKDGFLGFVKKGQVFEFQ